MYKPKTLDFDILPVRQVEDSLITAIKSHDIVCIKGEPGSGKSTQIPQILYELDFHEKGLICITQPRRISTKSIAFRITSENPQLKNITAYQTRYENTVTEYTRIKFVTDGILLNEIIFDTVLSKYSVIIIDEAHELRANTELLITLLFYVLKIRNTSSEFIPLKIIIMSATLDTSFFTKFKDMKISFIDVPGRTFPICTHYMKKTSSDFITDSCKIIKKIDKNLPPGNILVFLPGKKDLFEVKAILDEDSKKCKNTMQIFALYGSMNFSEQDLVVNSCLDIMPRKCILSTNVSETGITVPGVRYVVDSGLTKRRIYDYNKHAIEYVLTWESKSSANQRAGRAGRTTEGHVYRLFSSALYDRCFYEQDEPEILQIPLQKIFLVLMFMGFTNPENFPFLTSIPQIKMQTARKNLESQCLIKEKYILPKGKICLLFPIDINLSQLIAEYIIKQDNNLKLLSFIVRCVSVLSSRIMEEEIIYDFKKRKNNINSELLNLFQDIPLKYRQEISQIYKDIVNILFNRFKLEISSEFDFDDKLLLEKSLIRKFFRIYLKIFNENLCYLSTKGNFEQKIYYIRCRDGTKILLHNSSSFSNSPPNFVIFHNFFVLNNFQGFLIGKFPTEISNFSIVSSSKSENG